MTKTDLCSCICISEQPQSLTLVTAVQAPSLPDLCRWSRPDSIVGGGWLDAAPLVRGGVHPSVSLWTRSLSPAAQSHPLKLTVVWPDCAGAGCHTGF